MNMDNNFSFIHHSSIDSFSSSTVSASDAAAGGSCGAGAACDISGFGVGLLSKDILSSLDSDADIGGSCGLAAG
jgi:hypothetical protein